MLGDSEMAPSLGSIGGGGENSGIQARALLGLEMIAIGAWC